MGIDIYLYWEGQTEEERKAQYTGFSAVSGHVGYLREAYHGGPYATRILVPEAFSEEAGNNGGVQIPAAVLEERLPMTISAARERNSRIYNSSEKDIKEVCKSFSDFVELAKRKELETGSPCRIEASY